MLLKPNKSKINYKSGEMLSLKPRVERDGFIGATRSWSKIVAAEGFASGAISMGTQN